MLVGLYGPEASAMVDVPSNGVSWTALAGQQHGEVTLRVPRHSPAWRSETLPTKAGALLEIPTPQGLWQGIGDAPEWRPEGMLLTARQLTIWMGARPVGQRRFFGVTADVIVRAGFEDAFASVALLPLTLGPVLSAPPLLDVFEFRRQPYIDVLSELSARTGQEWTIDRRQRLVWVPRVGRMHDSWLVDDGGLLGVLRETALADTWSESLQLHRDGREDLARDPGAPLSWPSVQVVTS